MTREIVTVQIGTYANYVGAHFWNLQDEYLATPIQLRELSPSALFREIPALSSLYRSGLRYAPRLQVIDSTGAFGALSTQSGIVLADAISETEISAPAWGGQRQTYIRERIQPSAYIHQLQSEEREEKGDMCEANDCDGSEQGKHNDMFSNIRYWSDFLKVRLHPRTCTALEGVHHGVTNLDYFETGYDLASSPVEDWYDELRFFIEECDSFGGLNILTNADDAFSGISSAYIAHAVEELGASSPLMTFGVHHPKRFTTKACAEAFNAQFDSPTESLWSQNEARLAALCQEYSVEYVPLSSQVAQRMPMLHVRNDLFHSSAALGLALDVALTPLRLADSLSGMLSLLRPAPFANFGSLVCNIPKSAKDLNFGKNAIETEGTVNLSDAWKPCTRNGSAELVDRLRCVEVISSRGISEELPIHSAIDLPITLPIPFPSLFDPALLGRNPGKVVSESPEGVQMEQVCVVAGMATVPQVGRRALQALGESLKNVNCAQRRYGQTDFDEVREALQGRSEDYDSL